MSNGDSISSLYNSSDAFNKAANICFWLNAVAAAVSLIGCEKIQKYSMMAQVVFSLLCVIINLADECSFWFRAEAARRKNCIEDALSVDLSDEKSDGYYTNETEPSMLRYVLNCFESVHYSRAISAKMFPSTLLKTVLAVVSFLIAWRLSTEMGFALWLSGIVFSSAFVLGFIYLCFFRYRVRQIYDNFYRALITDSGSMSSTKIAILLAYVVDYEAIKAFYKVRLSGRLYEKYKNSISAEWEKHKDKIICAKAQN